MTIQRTTPTGRVLRLVVPEGAAPPPDRSEALLQALRDAARATKEGRFEHVVVLGVDPEGTLEMFNTIEDLADLGLLRDEFCDMVDEIRRER